MINNSPSNICIEKYIINHTLKIHVTPNAKTEIITDELGQLRLSVHAQPQDNKANLAVIKFFKKHFKLKVKIKLGQKSRDKVLEVH